MDLILIVITTLVTMSVAELTQGVPRIILGILVVLIFPGYTLLAALFPSKNSLKGIERTGLTAIASFSLIALIGLILNYSPWGFSLNSILISLGALIIVLALIGYFRRRVLPADAKFTIFPKINNLKLGNMSSSEKTFSILVGVAGLTAISLFIVMVAQPIKGQAFSEFYISKPHDVLANNPYSMALGDTLNLTLVVENHENQAVSYKVDILFNDVKIQSITYGNLKDKAVWSKNITLSPSIPGNNQKVEFQLYKNNDSTPYSTLRLWLAVTE